LLLQDLGRNSDSGNQRAAHERLATNRHQDITQSTIHLHRLCPGELGEGSRRHAAMMPSHMHSLVNELLMLT
jgi:hypothetical protein